VPALHGISKRSCTAAVDHSRAIASGVHRDEPAVPAPMMHAPSDNPADPWRLRLERVREKLASTGWSAHRNVPPRDQTATAYGHVAKVMTETG
jgi:hypothetical protein